MNKQTSIKQNKQTKTLCMFNSTVTLNWCTYRLVLLTWQFCFTPHPSHLFKLPASPPPSQVFLTASLAWQIDYVTVGSNLLFKWSTAFILFSQLRNFTFFWSLDGSCFIIRPCCPIRYIMNVSYVIIHVMCYYITCNEVDWHM